MSITPHGWAYAVVAAAAAVIAIAGGGVPSIAAACALASVGAWAAAAAWAGRTALKSTLDAPASAFSGERAPVEWRIENESWCFAFRVDRPSLRSTYAFEIPGGFVVPPRGTVRVPLRVPCRHRGEVTLGDLSMSVAGLPPLFAVRVEHDAEASVTVYPRPAVVERPLPEPEAEPQRTRLQAPWGWAQGEEEFTGVRDFRPGDPPRRIHWRASFRLPDQWRVKEYASPDAGEATIVLDCRRPSTAGLRWRADWERAISASGAVCRHLVDRGWTVRLMLPGETVTAHGRLDSVYRALAHVEPGPPNDAAMEGVTGVAYWLTPNEEPPPGPEWLAMTPDDLREYFSYM